MNEFVTIQSITEAHCLMGLGRPNHPMLSVFRHSPEMLKTFSRVKVITGFYSVSFKGGVSGTFGYGRSGYDFEEGTMVFIGPGQVITTPAENDMVLNDLGWTLFFHPDLISRSELGRIIDGYTFFNYDVNEALHLSEREKKTINDIIQNIERETEQNIDQHSQRLILSNIELLLNYCTRFYDRQFYTRTNHNADIVIRFEEVLKSYFNSGQQFDHGIPTVKYCAEKLNISANYLSDLLKKETNRNGQGHVHDFIIEKAKNLLLTSTEPVSEVAYSLGFDYSQHFSKLFKSKTGISPKEFRKVQ